jgi:HD-like signal output (HDOD) protein/CheY-like chemotaxis protein
MIRVMVVDDERQVSDALRRALRRHGDVSVTGVTGGRAALAALGGPLPDALVVDSLLAAPGATSVLQAWAEAAPTTLRFVLAGDSALQPLESILWLAHQLLPRPVTPELLMQSLREAMGARGELSTSANCSRWLSLRALPTLPSSYVSFEALFRDPRTTAAQLGSAVEQDPAVCVNVLRLANSAWFGATRAITSAREAALRLGRTMLRSVVLTASLFRLDDDVSRGLSLEALQRLRIAVALARAVGDPTWSNEFLTGVVLCDVGKLIFAQQCGDDWRRHRDAIANGVSALEAEKAAFGVTHAALGAAVLGIWGLPTAIVSLVAGHHQAGSAGQSETALHAVCLATELLAQPSVEVRVALDVVSRQLGISSDTLLSAAH